MTVARYPLRILRAPRATVNHRVIRPFADTGVRAPASAGRNDARAELTGSLLAWVTESGAALRPVLVDQPEHAGAGDRLAAAVNPELPVGPRGALLRR
jgi:hypothetical protein